MVQGCRQLVSDLLLRVDGLFAELDHKAAVDAEILRLGYQINAEYAQCEGPPPGSRRSNSVAQLQERIGPIKVEINKLRTESQAILDSIRSVEQEARDVVARCARVAPNLTPLLDQFWEVYGSRVAPDIELLKLRDLLAEARARLEAEPPPQTLRSSGSVTAGKEVPPDTSRKRARGPNLELHRERVALWDALASELTCIWQETKRYATVQGLKVKYPHFKIWDLLSDAEQKELLEREFTPRAYAGSLVLRKYGLKSRETLRASRKCVRNADRQQA